MGLSSGLTLQMDLIVLRNSIFCHSECTLCLSLGSDCSERALINSTQSVELRNWVLPQIKPWERAMDREHEWKEWETQIGGGWKLGIKSPDASTLLLRRKPHTLNITQLHREAQENVVCVALAYSITTHLDTWIQNCAKFASKPIDCVLNRKAFIRSNLLCYLLVLGANAQMEPFLSKDRGFVPLPMHLNLLMCSCASVMIC